MSEATPSPDLSGRRVLIPGGTGGVGEGAVRAYLAAGAQVVVPTRSNERAAEFRALLGSDATERLHLFEHDYTSFAGAEALVATMVDRLGGVDDVLAPIGGWWHGKRLWEIDETDWQGAFVGLATAHMAVLRAAVPRMTKQGAYSIVVGESAHAPIPGSGLVSMEQTALLMMHQVLAAELQGTKRVFLLELGPVATRFVETADPSQITSAQIGAVAAAASASTQPGRHVRLLNRAQAEDALASFGAAQ
ncbi:SDR family oxidoreductase [Actinospica sp. MGRD01-02]|uniref:SDR family oxidoreductase n=1 Tax=Actinospica acidithermotolerans TaxID=2828514 RepID=A0A941IHR0_9ACTN|nr:SDR family oxidoreductase [Actinospica acidithermotolerans]MBR7828795.1 SDR family oxidoreductase [Actinospica acidithermotolerans]